MGLFDELQNTPEVPEDNQLLEARGESLEAPEVAPETPEEALLVARSGRKAVEQEEGMEFGNPTDFAEQFNNTLISAIGAPVDLTTWALNGASKLLGGPELIDPETAVGGSASLKSALNPLDIGSDREADTYMGYAGNTFGEAAAFLAGGAGIVQKTKQAKGVIGSISKQADEALRTKLDDVVAVEATAALGMAGGRQYAEENEMGATGSLVLEFTTGALAMVSGAGAKKVILDPLTAKLKNMTPKEALENLSKEEVSEVVAEGQRVIAKEQPSPKKTPEPEEAPKAPEASATTATPKDTPEPTPAPKTPEAAPEVDPTSASGDAIDASIKATREILEGDRSGGKGARVTAQVKPHFKAVASDMADRFNDFAKATKTAEAKKTAEVILERLDQFIEFDRIIAKKDYAQGSELVANKGGITPESFRTEISAEANKRSADLQTLRNMLNDFVGDKTTKKDASKAAQAASASITPQQKVEAIRNHLQSISRGRSRGALMSVFDGYFTTRTAMALNQVKTGLVGTMSAAIKHILRPLENTLNSTDSAARLKDTSVRRRLKYALSEIAATDEYIITTVRHHRAILKNMGNTMLETGDSTLLYKEAQAYKGQDTINGQPSNFFARRNNARAARNVAYRDAKTPLDKSYKGLKKAMLNNSLADSVPLIFNYGFSLIGAFEDISLMTLSRRAQKARAIQSGIREGVEDIGKYVDDWMDDAFQIQENGTMRANYDPKYQDGFNEARYDHFRNLDLPANDIRNEAEQAVVAALNKVAESPTELGMLTKFIMMFRGVPTRAGAQLLAYTPPVAGYKVARQLVGKGVNAVEKRVGTGQVSFGKYQSKISELELQIKEQKAILKSADDSDIVKAAEATIADNEDQIGRLNVMRREEEYRDIARFVIATGIFLKGYQDGQMGLATGSQSHLTDEQKFAAQKVDGAPTDWKIRFGELELDYRYAEPLKGAYGMGASWGQRQATIDAGALTKDQTATQFFVSAYRDMLLDMPALQGAKTVVQTTSANPETRAKAATNLKRQSIPAPAELRNILKYDEEFIGDTTQGSSTQSAWRAAVGLEQDNYKLTVLGEPKQKETPTLVGHITPLGLKKAVERTELDDLLLEDAFTFRSISAPQTSVGGFQLKKFVHADEDNGETLYSLYGRLISETRIGGRTQRQALEALIKTSDFKRAYNNNKYTMDDKGAEINEGIEMIKDIISEYRAEARSQILENKAANDYVDSDGNNIYDILKEREEFSEQPESLLESLNLQ